MNYQTHKDNDHSVIEIEGEVDLACSPDVRKALLGILENTEPLVINLNAVTYIDSSGIASLVEAYQTAKKKQLGFALVSVSEAVMNVLKLARLDQVFPIYNDFEAYLEST